MKYSLLYAITATVAMVTLSGQRFEVFAGGAVFTRWGHDRCPHSAMLAYSGFAGGSWYHHHGGAAEYLCLPKNPIRLNDHRRYRYVGLVYGAEYEMRRRRGVNYRLHNHKVPCAVCQSKRRQHVIMLPARNICPAGWLREYHGQLMSGDYDENGPSQYACVDRAKRSLHGGSHHNDNGKLFYPVKAQCGSLKCPPYVNNMLLSCAVSKSSTGPVKFMYCNMKAGQETGVQEIRTFQLMKRKQQKPFDTNLAITNSL